jgi:aminoglycoside 3-N-acetyltransferase
MTQHGSHGETVRFGDDMEGMTREDITEALHALGLAAGDVVMVHSSLRSIGYVAGGADTVVNALLDVLSPSGTLVVPTFTPSHGREADPVFDPARDPSEVGQITEVVRRRSGARRSVHLLHSVAALGARSAEIAGQHGPAAFAADGPFWRVQELNGWLLLLGVPYLRCTYVHVPEMLVQSIYRYWREVEARVRDPDGTERPLLLRSFAPKLGYPPDLNKVGAALEARGLVRIGPVGNAVARLFRARDLIDVGIAEYRKDPFAFVKTGDDYATLRDGVLAEELYTEKAVYDPGRIFPRASR